MPKAKQTTPVDVMAEINSIFPGAMMLGSDPELLATRTPIGDDPLDYLLDGGVARGRIIELYGPYSTLKSYTAYRAIGAHQRAGKRCALIDYEHSWDPEWGGELGVNTRKLHVARPETAEQGITIMDALVKQGYDLVVWDSIAAAQPAQYRKVQAGEDDAPAALARVMSRGLPRVVASNKHTALVFINQTRATIGVTFGAKSTTSGGKAMGFYASMRISFTRTGRITKTVKRWDGEAYIDAKHVTGHKIMATLEKSKLSAPYSEVHFVFDLTTGQIDNTGWLVGRAMENGLIVQRGAYYDIPGVLDKPIQGKGGLRTWVEENEEEVVAWLREELLKIDSDLATG